MENWFKKVRSFFGAETRTASILAIASIAFALGTVALTAVLIWTNAGDGILRLRYTAAFGVNWAAAWWKGLVFPSVALVALVVNGWLAGRLLRRHRALAALLWGMTLLVQVTLAGAAFIAIQLNA